MKMMVLSVKETSFKDKQTGQDRAMWQVFCADETGAVGSMYSAEPILSGQEIEVKLLANRDGKFAPKIIHAPKTGAAKGPNKIN